MYGKGFIYDGCFFDFFILIGIYIMVVLVNICFFWVDMVMLLVFLVVRFVLVFMLILIILLNVLCRFLFI